MDKNVENMRQEQTANGAEISQAVLSYWPMGYVVPKALTYEQHMKEEAKLEEQQNKKCQPSLS